MMSMEPCPWTWPLPWALVSGSGIVKRHAVGAHPRVVFSLQGSLREYQAHRQDSMSNFRPPLSQLLPWHIRIGGREGGRGTGNGGEGRGSEGVGREVCRKRSVISVDGMNSCAFPEPFPPRSSGRNPDTDYSAWSMDKRTASPGNGKKKWRRDNEKENKPSRQKKTSVSCVVMTTLLYNTSSTHGTRAFRRAAHHGVCVPSALASVKSVREGAHPPAQPPTSLSAEILIKLRGLAQTSWRCFRHPVGTGEGWEEREEPSTVFSACLCGYVYQVGRLGWFTMWVKRRWGG